MALSGSITTGEMQGRSITFSWSATQSITNNTSTVSWRVYTSGSYGGGVAVRAVTATINGTQVYHTDNYNGIYGGHVPPNVTIASGTTTISHNSVGAGSFTAYIGAGIYYRWSINTEATKTFTLNTIARASSVSSTAFTLGEAGTITIAKPASSSFTHTLSYTYGSASGTIATGLRGSAAITQKWTPDISFAKYTPNATTGVGAIICNTYNGGTLIGTKTATFTAIVPNSLKPTLNSLSYELDNSDNETIKKWGIAVAGYTKCRLIASASGIYGSTISNYTISGGYSTTVPTSSLDYTGDKITTNDRVTFSAYATDSRNRRSSSSSFSIIVYAYSNPSISSFTAQRNTEDTEKVDITGVWNYSSVNGNNEAIPTLKYKKSGSNTWTTYSGTLSSGVTTTLPSTFNSNDIYEFQLSVTDSVGNSNVATNTVYTEEALLDFKAGGTALGIGQLVPNSEDKVVYLNSDWDIKVFGESLRELLDGNLTTHQVGDYVIESGDSATLGLDTSLFQKSDTTHIYWQKWNSGKLEIWGRSHCNGNASITTSSWANGFQSAYFTLWGTWPIEFIAPPCVSVQLTGADTDDTIGDYMIIWKGVKAADGSLATKSQKFKFWRGSAAVFGHPQLSFTATGRWK